MIPIDHPAAFEWVTPDADPFRGTLEQAIALFDKAGLATQWALDRLTRQDHCRLRELRDGEYIEAMTFGRDRLERSVVAETSQWPVTVLRTVLECQDGLGNALLFPLACGNWSFEYVRPTPIYAQPEYQGWAYPPYGEQTGFPVPLWWWPGGGGYEVFGPGVLVGPGPNELERFLQQPNQPEVEVTFTDEPSALSLLTVGLLFLLGLTIHRARCFTWGSSRRQF